jgi:hypothetical protein
MSRYLFPSVQSTTMFTQYIILTAAALFAATALANPLSRRSGDFTDADLLHSCPGGAGKSDMLHYIWFVHPTLSTLAFQGSPKLKRADRCVLKDPKPQPDVRYWHVLGDPQMKYVRQ